MKKFLDFVEEIAFGIFVFIGLFALFVLSIIPVIQVLKTDIYDLEENCFNFYKENNYILEECNKYSDKLKGE